MSLGFYATCLIVVLLVCINVERQRRIRDEEEQQRRIRDEEERQRRIRDEEERQQQQRFNEAAMKLREDIDFYIRSRNQFDSRSPLTYRCDIGSVAQDTKVIESLDYFNNLLVCEHGHQEMNLREFVRTSRDFVLENSNKIGVRTLTPFQGEVKHRVYGYLSCFDCNRNWQSAATYANKWQKCQICEAKCYPYYQHALERSEQNEDEDEDDDSNRRPHDTSRCQRCLELGRICLPNRYYAV